MSLQINWQLFAAAFIAGFAFSFGSWLFGKFLK